MKLLHGRAVDVAQDFRLTIDKDGKYIFQTAMAMVNYIKRIGAITLIVQLLVFLYGCSVFYPTTYVQVPKGYAGWCFVVPIADTSRLIDKHGEFYRADSHGVTYVPASHLDLRKDNGVEVYEGGKEITAYTKYTGRQETTINEKKYDYILFLLPDQKEREIDNEEYWRNKGYEHTTTAIALFDSLLQHNLISIKSRSY